jgi:hypothetical protein
VIVAAAFLAVTLAACSSPVKPSVSVASGHPVSPTTGAQFSYYSQPVRLVIANGVVTHGALITTVDVATDAAFTSVVTTQTVSPDATGQLALTLDHLTPATTYYWRVKTAAGDNPGVFSSPASFTIGPLLVIQPPVSVQPLADSFPHKRPTFTVMNATHTGPDATLTYRFDVATDSAFTNVLTSGTASEGSVQTSFTPSVDLTSGATYYWRAQASDTMKGVAGGRSAPQVFTTVNPDDGSFPYTLHVHCRTGFQDNFDAPRGLLEVNGDKLRLAGLPPLNLQLTRVGKRLSGTMGGPFQISRPYVLDIGARRNPVPYYWNPEGSASLSGDAADDGTLSGTFEGYAVVGYYPEVHECTAPFSCTLTPH